MDQGGEIRDFLRIVDDDTPEAKDKLLALIQEALIEHIDRVLAEGIDGKQVVGDDGNVVISDETGRPASLRSLFISLI